MQAEPLDVFVSHARVDNVAGRMTAFAERLNLPGLPEERICRWEFTEHLKGKIGQNLDGAGIAPVYAFTIPGCRRFSPLHRSPSAP